MPDTSRAGRAKSAEDLPIRMLHDRVLLSSESEGGERQTGNGLLIPATASLGKRLHWATVRAIGQHVRQVELGDRVLYDPADRAEVEVNGRAYLLLRERDLHAVDSRGPQPDSTGLYL